MTDFSHISVADYNPTGYGPGSYPKKLKSGSPFLLKYAWFKDVFIWLQSFVLTHINAMQVFSQVSSNWLRLF